MATPPPRIVALAFHKPMSHPLLVQLEELFVYGVLSQSARFSEMSYRDMATLADRMVFEPQSTPEETLQKLAKISQSTRGNYVLTGTITATFQQTQVEQIKMNVCLFDARKNQLTVDEVITLNPDPPSPEHPLGLSTDVLNQLINRATQWILTAIFENAVANQPFNAPFSHSYQAMVSVLQAHKTTTPTDKISLYEAALQFDPKMETAYYHLARLYRSEKDYQNSVLNYVKTLEVSQSTKRNKAIYATDAGIGCALMGKHELALQWWKHAIEYDPSYINPYFNIANTYEDQGNFADAEWYFVRSQELAPDDYRTFFNLARIYSKTGAWDKALDQYRLQLTTEDEDPWCHSDIATCYLNLGDVENARAHLERSVSLDPDGEAGEYAQLILSGLG